MTTTKTIPTLMQLFDAMDDEAKHSLSTKAFYIGFVRILLEATCLTVEADDVRAYVRSWRMRARTEDINWMTARSKYDFCDFALSDFQERFGMKAVSA